MPIPLLLAMILAFGLRLPSDAAPLSSPDLRLRLIEAVLAVLAVGAMALVFGQVLRSLTKRSCVSASRQRRLFLWGSRLFLLSSLIVFAWTLVSLDWQRVVARGLGLKDVVILEQAALIAPYVLTQILIWCGLYPAESAMLPWSPERRFSGYLLMKIRHTFGMMIPMAILYGLTREISAFRPNGFTHAAWPLVGSLAVGLLVFLLSPAFVRLCWPTRRLPDGALRDRLERLAGRLKFRYTDLLLWDTGGLVVNAGVTGAVPWFRYVLITDAMIEVLDDQEIEAVFGHEVGHIAHQHLPFFALFCLGSMGLLTFVFEGISSLWDVGRVIERVFPDPMVAEVVPAAVQLLALALYFYFVFGFLSRQFERQADVYGCKAVSCGMQVCPAEHDPNCPGEDRRSPATACPSGIGLFAEALSQVAQINGTSPSAYSWRHGSIARRIQFLHLIESDPSIEPRFQRNVLRTRWVFMGLLAASSVGALVLVSRGVTS